MDNTPDQQRHTVAALSTVLREEHAKRRIAWIQIATIVLVLACVVFIAVLAVLDHPHRAALMVVVLLYCLALVRAVWPGRPWFASRHRWMDVVVYILVGSAVWFLSPFTALMLSMQP